MELKLPRAQRHSGGVGASVRPTRAGLDWNEACGVLLVPKFPWLSAAAVSLRGQNWDLHASFSTLGGDAHDLLARGQTCLTRRPWAYVGVAVVRRLGGPILQELLGGPGEVSLRARKVPFLPSHLNDCQTECRNLEMIFFPEAIVPFFSKLK